MVGPDRGPAGTLGPFPIVFERTESGGDSNPAPARSVTGLRVLAARPWQLSRIPRIPTAARRRGEERSPGGSALDSCSLFAILERL
jgi:hypothetical protein